MLIHGGWGCNIFRQTFFPFKFPSLAHFLGTMIILYSLQLLLQVEYIVISFDLLEQSKECGLLWRNERKRVAWLLDQLARWMGNPCGSKMQSKSVCLLQISIICEIFIFYIPTNKPRYGIQILQLEILLSMVPIQSSTNPEFSGHVDALEGAQGTYPGWPPLQPGKRSPCNS